MPVRTTAGCTMRKGVRTLTFAWACGVAVQRLVVHKANTRSSAGSKDFFSKKGVLEKRWKSFQSFRELKADTPAELAGALGGVLRWRA